VEKDTWELMSVIRDRIDQIMIHETDKSMTQELFGQLFTNFRGREDSTLALIICMAKNLETLSICKASWATKRVLAFPWQQVENRPLGKLKDLEICACGRMRKPPLVILPTMERLSVKNWMGYGRGRFKQKLVFPAPKPDNPVLHTVKFGVMSMKPAGIERMVQSPWFANLKTLEVQGVFEMKFQYDSDSEDDEETDMVPLLKSLEKHTPRLERFEWGYQLKTFPEVKVFDDFRRLPRLKHLTVDFALLASEKDMYDKLMYPREVFPDSLETLTISTISLGTIDPKPKENAQSSAPTPAAARVQMIKAMAAASQIKHLQLHIVLEKPNDDRLDAVDLQELTPLTISLLRAAADELKMSDVVLEVFRTRGTYEEQKLIFAPGYTAPTPHSVRLRRPLATDEEWLW